MNKRMLFFALSFFLLTACDDSSNNNSVEASDSNLSIKNSIHDEVVLPECEKSLQSLTDGKDVVSQKNTKDTVCFYENFAVKDTICCFGEVGTWLERDENGKYINVSGDYSKGIKYDTLFAAVEPSSIHRCKASVGNEHYNAVKIGLQTWFSENAKGEGRCLNDNDENCSLFGSLMTYDQAEKVCSGDYRLPTSADVENLLQSVGAVVKTSYTKDLCGEFPDEILYFDAPLFVNAQDSLSNLFGFSFPMKGGAYDRGIQGTKKLDYYAERTCFFLQSDENTNFRKAFCYDVNEKYATVTSLEKKAELYVRCVMK